jgi:hypothetical protein
MLLFAKLALAAALPLALAPSPAGGSTTDVLFLGNSYTAVNDLPGIFVGLAGAAGKPVNVSSNTPGGCTLGSPQGGIEHKNNPTSLALIDQGGWDFVVLQEQSVTPAIPYTKSHFMLPAATELDTRIHAATPGATTLFYQTWGRQNSGTWCWSSWCSPPFTSFDAMQDVLTASYDEAAASVGGEVAPVGEAWRLFFEENPGQVLHAADGAHPNKFGSYLAGCVFYAKVFGASPVGNSYTGTLATAEAAILQDVAARAVFGPTCGISEYGLGLATAWHLSASGSASLGGTVTLDPVGAPADALGTWFAVSLGETSSPLFGGTLLVDLGQLATPLHFQTATTAWPLAMPSAPSLGGLELFVQGATQTATQPSGWGLSQGIRLQVCP